MNTARTARTAHTAHGTARALAPAAVLLLLALTACGTDTASDAPSGGTHPVKTAEGTVSVPDRPRRVVVLDTAELDSALTLGVQPVGATKADVGTSFLGYLPESKTSGIANVGTIGSPNLERIAALEPDLILTSAVRDAKNYDQLKAIAPTVMTESTGYPWKQNFLVHADALGRKPEAQQVLDSYRTHTRKVTKSLGGRGAAGKLDVNVVRFIAGADTRIYGEKSYIATILRDVGLGRPPVAEEATSYDGLALDISPEQLDKADADAVFYASYGPPSKSGEEKALKSPLWKNMRATGKNRTFRVDDELWIQGIGYTAAHKILNELERSLVRATGPGSGG